MRIRSLLAMCAICVLASTAHANSTLTWWHHMPLEGAQGKLFQQYADEFMASHPDVDIEILSIPHKNYYTKLTAAIASGGAPDVFGLSYRRLYGFEENGILAPIDAAALKSMGLGSIDELQAVWAPSVLDAYRVGDTFYGLPFQFNIYAFIINTKHFREAGLDPDKDYPKTWDELMAVGQKLTKKVGGRVVRQGMSFPFVNSEAWYMLELEPIMRELGGSILNADQTESLIDSEAGVKAMEILKKRFDLGITDKDIAVGLDYHNEGFPTGKFSITIGGNWGIPRWLKNFKDTVKEGDFKAIPTPTFEGLPTATSTTSWAWTVFSGSDKKALAWEFANFLTSMPSRNILMTGDIIPRAGWSESEGGKSLPQAKFWEEMLQYSQPLAAFKKYSEVVDHLKKAMEDILLNDKDIKKTLDRAKADIDAILGD